MSKHQVSIDVNTGRVLIGYTIPDTELGFIVFDEDGYYLKVSNWQPADRNYFLSGVIEDIRYLGQDGKVHLGSLDLCFARGKHHLKVTEK